MRARDPAILLAPEEKDDTIVVSRKKLDELVRQAERRERENERLRRENAELRRRLQVHENPNVPPSGRNHAPGYTRARPLVPLTNGRRPGRSQATTGSRANCWSPTSGSSTPPAPVRSVAATD